MGYIYSFYKVQNKSTEYFRFDFYKYFFTLFNQRVRNLFTIIKLKVFYIFVWSFAYK